MFDNVIICLGAFSIPILIVVTQNHFKNQERQRWHETVRLALEKGQPIPNLADFPSDRDENEKGGKNPRFAQHRQTMGLSISGLVNLAVGIGLFVALAHLPGAAAARYFALIPGLIGVALLISGLLHAALARRLFESGERPPRT